MSSSYMSFSWRPAVPLLLALVFAAPAAVGSPRATDSDIRVRILADTQPRRVSFAVVSGSYTVSTSGDASERVYGEGESFTVVRDRSVVRLVVESGATSLSFVRASPDQTGASFQIKVVEGKRTLARSYDGALDLRADRDGDETLLLVNSVPLESYVAAVVTSEYGLDDIEGTKAMAVLARTYALKSAGTAGSDYDHVDHELSQVYRGLEGLGRRAIDAAESTRSEIVLYKGTLAETVYHAESGGHTADNDAVWEGSPVEYLRGVKDPFANKSPYASWRFDASRRRLLRTLSSLAGSTISGFVLDGRSSDGRVATVRLISSRGNIVVSGNQFRLAVIGEFGASALKSTLFDVKRVGDAYRFSGSGFGHGVGVSQWGAHEMARRGYSYDEIIAFYLRGVELAKLPDTSPDVRRLAAAETTSAAPSGDDARATERPERALETPVTVDKPDLTKTSRRTRRGRIGW